MERFLFDPILMLLVPFFLLQILKQFLLTYFVLLLNLKNLFFFFVFLKKELLKRFKIISFFLPSGKFENDLKKREPVFILLIVVNLFNVVNLLNVEPKEELLEERGLVEVIEVEKYLKEGRTRSSLLNLKVFLIILIDLNEFIITFKLS